MKTSKILAVAVSFIAMSTAFASESGKAHVLSIQYVMEGTTTVALPTVKNPDGSICQSYVAEASRVDNGRIDTTVKQICGAANASNSAPGNLTSIGNFSSDDGMTVQTPTVSISQ